ncbi:hypothetical protein [Sphingosinicella terrae]|uniref:hypothetical protein n=1 Tax=Sphingosinicella terrae TaxID=2172047 RepID=UPI0013B3E834|nr:hypothetical protein [Sphingosinicella terrae]
MEPSGALHIRAIRLVGATPENRSKPLLDLALLLLVLLFAGAGRSSTATRRERLARLDEAGRGIGLGDLPDHRPRRLKQERMEA